jgi:hypothetical protein
LLHLHQIVGSDKQGDPLGLAVCACLVKKIEFIVEKEE